MRFTDGQACEFIHKLKASYRTSDMPATGCYRAGEATGYLCAMPVHVSSEIGRLALRPRALAGPELLAVTPSNRADYLYDDIIEAESAQRSTGGSSRSSSGSRPSTRSATCWPMFWRTPDVARPAHPRDDGHRSVASRSRATSASSPPTALVRMLIEGREEPPGPIAKALNEPGYVLPPLPNLFFTRDSWSPAGTCSSARCATRSAGRKRSS